MDFAFRLRKLMMRKCNLLSAGEKSNFNQSGHASAHQTEDVLYSMLLVSKNGCGSDPVAQRDGLDVRCVLLCAR
jgi:hypothetical protein